MILAEEGIFAIALADYTPSRPCPHTYSMPMSNLATLAPFKVAAVQAEPVWLDAKATVTKTIQLIDEAAQQGAKLIAFPELWIPGYPYYLWVKDFGSSMPMNLNYAANALEIDSEEIGAIRSACANHGIWTSFGFAERRNGSMYMSNCIISDGGEIVNVRRKLKPTGLERILFGEASADALDNVVTTPFGRLGNLQCWEHLQPLLKFHTFSLHEQIHVASWPGVFPLKGSEPYSMSSAGIKAITQTYAMEGGSFTIMATQVISDHGAEAIGLDYKPNGPAEHDFFLPPGGGCSAIFAPDGRQLTTDLAPTQEGILYAQVNYVMASATKLLADCVGHYSRPDLLHAERRKRQILDWSQFTIAPQPANDEEGLKLVGRVRYSIYFENDMTVHKQLLLTNVM